MPSCFIKQDEIISEKAFDQLIVRFSSTVQYSAVQYSAVQYSAVQYSTLLHYNSTRYCFVKALGRDLTCRNDDDE